MKIQIFRLVFILLLGIITIPICDCTKKEEFNNSDIAIVDIKQESTWDYWVVCKDGDYFFLQETNSKPSNVLMHIGKTNTDIPIFFNQEGLPEKVIIGDYIFVLKNHSGTYVDLAVILPNGEIEVAKNIKSETDWDQFKTKNSNTTGALSDVIRWTGHAVGAIPCVISLAALPSLIAIPFAVWACGNYLLGYLVDAKENELEITYGITDFAKNWRYANVVAKCTTPDFVSCASSVVSTSLSDFADYVETLEQNSDKISEATTILNNGLIIFNPNLTYGTLSDVDGNIYKTIQIGTQTWMAENLKTTIYNDHTTIPCVTAMMAWFSLTTPGYSWFNNDEAANKATYGALYNWYVVDGTSNSGKNVCPEGWHVPSITEWTELLNYLGGESVAGGKLKETGTTHWDAPNGLATNDAGFTALPGTSRYSTGAFPYFLGNYGKWWSSTESSSTNAFCQEMTFENGISTSYDDTKREGISVRCLKDN